MSFAQKTDILRFFAEKVRPAFEALKEEFAKRGIIAEIKENQKDALSVELMIVHDQIWNFRYGVRAEKRNISDYLIDEDNTPDAATNQQYIPITYYSDGRTGNDIQYLNKEEIIADVLREYERYLSVVSDEEKAMMFVDKEKYKL